MVTGIAVGVVVLALGTAALAHGREGRGDRDGKRDGGRDGIGRMTERLDLTADQRAKIAKLKEEMRGKAQPLDQKLRDLKAQERAAWTADKPDEAKVVALHRETLALRGQIDELRIAQRFDVWALLTPAQRATLRTNTLPRPTVHR
jgi:Spy/CpxP family protein refolding chaperone